MGFVLYSLWFIILYSHGENWSSFDTKEAEPDTLNSMETSLCYILLHHLLYIERRICTWGMTTFTLLGWNLGLETVTATNEHGPVSLLVGRSPVFFLETRMWRAAAYPAASPPMNCKPFLNQQWKPADRSHALPIQSNHQHRPWVRIWVDQEQGCMALACQDGGNYEAWYEK